jgi:iron complex outermembrane receptor protein
MRTWTTTILSLVTACSLTAQEQEAKYTAKELSRLSLAELMDIPVSLTSRREERLWDAAAPTTVITGDELRRAGINSLPEALRLAPGFHVGRVDAHTWAISARGFNDTFANKLLVMIDGRTVYTPLFSGVYWDVQDTVLEDIEKIEIVRGPGAALWGANAVNGVVNIVTKKAGETHGGLVSGGGGTEERSFLSARYGFKLSEKTHLRVFGKWFQHDESVLPNGDDAHDAWQMSRGGFRLDSTLNPQNEVTLQAEAFTADLNQTYFAPTAAPPFATAVRDRFDVNGGNILGRWNHEFSESSQFTLQSYYDQTDRRSFIFQELRQTIDLDFQHQVSLGERNEFIYGAGYRYTTDETTGSPVARLFPADEGKNLFSGFVQDQFAIVPDKFFTVLGVKLEHYDISGFEVQPSLRLLWKVAPKHTLWAAVSRAVRTPSRAEQDIAIDSPGAPRGFATIFGSRDFGSETLVAYELGYRTQPATSVTVDFNLFWHAYEDLRSIRPFGPAGLRQSQVGNDLEGNAYGIEIAPAYQAFEWWRLSGGYSLFQAELEARSPSLTTAESQEGLSPQQQFFLRSSWDLGRQVEFDSTVRYVDPVETFGIPAYWSLDLRLGWKIRPNLEFALIGRNLLDPQHPEFVPTTIATERTEVERSVMAKLTYRF